SVITGRASSVVRSLSIAPILAASADSPLMPIVPAWIVVTFAISAHLRVGVCDAEGLRGERHAATGRGDQDDVVPGHQPARQRLRIFRGKTEHQAAGIRADR